MKNTVAFLLAAVLTACGPVGSPEKKGVPAVVELATDSVRLKKLRQQ